MSGLPTLLNEIRSQRSIAIYVGETSLSRLADFLRGCEFALMREHPDQTEAFLPAFREWLYRRFNSSDNVSWDALILRNSVSQADGLRQFWTLIDEFLRETSESNGTRKSELPSFAV